MSSFFKKVKTMKEKQIIQPDDRKVSEMIDKKLINCIQKEQLSDVYKYVDETNAKLNKSYRESRELNKELKNELELLNVKCQELEKAKEPVIAIAKRPKPKIHPLTLPEGYSRKSIHQLTESAQLKVNTDVPAKPMIMMDRSNHVESSG